MPEGIGYPNTPVGRKRKAIAKKGKKRFETERGAKPLGGLRKRLVK